MTHVTVATRQDPDGVAPYIDRGTEFELIEETDKRLRLKTENGSHVVATASEFAPHVWRFGTGGSSKAALVMFERSVGECDS